MAIPPRPDPRAPTSTGGVIAAFPLLAVPVAAYAVAVALGATGGLQAMDADQSLLPPLFQVTMASGAAWGVSAGDLLVFGALVVLFVELLKSTTSRGAAIVNHALSLLLLIGCLSAFLLLRAFATSTFFLLTVMVLLDVLAGFIVTIIASRRDYGVAAD